jgi:predicted permease
LLSGSLPQVLLAVAGTVLVAGVLSFLLFRGRRLPAEHQTVLRVTSMFGNVSFLGIPLCYGLFGQEGLMYASLYAAAQDLLFWSVGAAMMGNGSVRLDWKRLINPSLIGIMLAAVLVGTGLPVPAFVMKATSTVGAATLPLSLLVVGAGFHGVRLKGRTLLDLLPVAGLKLVLVPAIVGLLLPLVPMEPVARAVLAMEIAMPSAAATVALARTNGQDWQFAAGAVMVTTVLSAVTVPLLVLLLNS